MLYRNLLYLWVFICVCNPSPSNNHLKLPKLTIIVVNLYLNLAHYYICNPCPYNCSAVLKLRPNWKLPYLQSSMCLQAFKTHLSKMMFEVENLHTCILIFLCFTTFGTLLVTAVWLYWNCFQIEGFHSCEAFDVYMPLNNPLHLSKTTFKTVNPDTWFESCCASLYLWYFLLQLLTLTIIASKEKSAILVSFYMSATVEATAWNCLKWRI